MLRRFTIVIALAALVATGLAQDKTVIGVSIPSATHGWTGGINYWAAEAEKRLEAQYPSIDFIIATAGSSEEQANDLQDLVAVSQIDALVILPFESDPLTAPV